MRTILNILIFALLTGFHQGHLQYGCSAIMCCCYAMNLNVFNIATVVAAMTYVIICCMCCSYKCLSHSSYLWTCLTRWWEENRSYSRLSSSTTCSVMLMSQLRCRLLMIIRVSLSLPTVPPVMSNVPRLLLSGYVSVLRLCYCLVFLYLY